MKNLLLVICFLLMSLLPGITLAQNKFIEGYIVSLTNDTIRGFIFDERLDMETRKIQFKERIENGVTKTYKPTEIKSFYVKAYDEHFVGWAGDIDIKPSDVRQLETNPTAKVKKDTVFLKLLVSGKISLYAFNEKVKQHFFIQEINAVPIELTYITFLSGSTGLVEVPIFKQQLKNLIKDCPTVNANNLRFNQIQLVNLITKYNSCFGLANGYLKKTVKNPAKFQVLWGASLNALKYQGFDNGGKYNYSGGRPAPLVQTMSFSPSVSLVLGAGLVFSSSRPSNRVSYALNLLGKISSRYNGSAESITTMQEASFSYSFISMMGMVRYTFINSKKKSYFLFGPSLAYSISNYNQLTVNRQIDGYQYYQGVASKMSNTGIGFTAGFGLPLSEKFFSELRIGQDLKNGEADSRIKISSVSILFSANIN